MPGLQPRHRTDRSAAPFSPRGDRTGLFLSLKVRECALDKSLQRMLKTSKMRPLSLPLRTHREQFPPLQKITLLWRTIK
jgi:hypothetical protein